MKDSYGRQIKYLRLSVTDLCNYRCIYCMGEDGVPKMPHGYSMSIEEMTEIAKAAYDLGIKKIRLTGGEPLVRRGVITLCRNIKSISDEIELSVTTNGSLLSAMAQQLKDAGVDRLNISLDTLDKETFRKITRVGELSDVLNGIEAAEKAGFSDVKINTVLLGGLNDADVLDLIMMTKDRDIQVRFIELMPMGEVKNLGRDMFVNISALDGYLNNSKLISVDGVAKVYRLPGHKGTVGLISPMSASFCGTCDKIRVTPDGKLKPCLHSAEEIDLRGLTGDELREAIKDGIMKKPAKHMLGERGSETDRSMNEIGG